MTMLRPSMRGLDSTDANLGDVVGETLEQADAHLRALLLTAAELDHGLDLVTGAEEAQRVAALGLVVVGVDLQAEADFLQNRVRLVLPGLTGLDSSFVLVLAEVHQFAHRRLGLRCYLNKIQVRLGSQTQGILNTDNANLLACWSYQPHLGDADTIIDSWLANV